MQIFTKQKEKFLFKPAEKFHLTELESILILSIMSEAREFQLEIKRLLNLYYTEEQSFNELQQEKIMAKELRETYRIKMVEQENKVDRIRRKQSLRQDSMAAHKNQIQHCLDQLHEMSIENSRIPNTPKHVKDMTEEIWTDLLQDQIIKQLIQLKSNTQGFKQDNV